MLGLSVNMVHHCSSFNMVFMKMFIFVKIVKKIIFSRKFSRNLPNFFLSSEDNQIFPKTVNFFILPHAFPPVLSMFSRKF
jgi:hypothetical protein